MTKDSNLIIFKLDNQKFALKLVDVKRVARVAEITPLPSAPDIVMGIINIHGEVIPVVNIRKRFNLPERDIELDNYFIVGRTSKRLVAILVDDIENIVEIQKQKIVEKKNILPGVEYIEGVVKLEGDIVLIQNLEEFLSLDEEKKLDNAMSSLTKDKGKKKVKK